MDENMLKDLVKTKNVLKNKYLQLKTGQNMRETQLENTFKPIVEPLKKLIENERKDNFQQEKLKNRKLLFKSFDEKNETDHEQTSPLTQELESIDDSLIFSTPKNITGSNRMPFLTKSMNEPDKTSSFTQKILSESNRDTNYGPYFDVNTQTVKIGSCNFEMNENDIIIGGETFGRTPGLIELMLKKNPRKHKYDANDLEEYGKILQKTNAHRINHDSSSRMKGNRGTKYTQIIKKLVVGLKAESEKTGGSYSDTTEMKYTNKNMEYVFWNDPNELVNRLRLLTASKNAGNNNHQNEINSIIEELKESNIIY